MAGEVERKKAPDWAGIAAPVVARLATRETAIALAFAVLTFALYWYLGPKETVYSYQTSQANNLVHGHLDLQPEYSLNLGVLERVMYDGDRFCLPPGDESKLETIVEYNDAIERGVPAGEAAALVISPTCKLYMQHSLGPSLMVIPGVLIWGKELNQTLVSAVIGALTAVIVYAVARKLSEELITQVSLTALMLFGTIFWWVAANGGVWFFAHTTAVFFLFGAIYFTVVQRNPIAAGALLGAAYMCRPPVIMTGLFFPVMFSDLWLKPREEGQSLLQRIDVLPLAQFAAGLAPFLLVSGLLNFVRYDDPLEYGYSYVESSHQEYLAYQYRFGTLDIRYFDLHPPVIFGAMPVFQQGGPYVLPSWYGMAIWVSTPAFFYGLFANIKRYLGFTVFGAVILAISCGFLLSKAIARAWSTGWSTTDPALGMEYLPFWVMSAVAVGAGLYFRDKVTVACWAAIIPTTLVLFAFAFVGYAQFGYRYSLDFTPFLWLLVAHAITSSTRIKWYYYTPLIVASIAVNVWGVLWIYQFHPHQTNGWEWVVF